MVYANLWTAMLSNLGKNLVSDGTFCTTFCSTQLKREISTHLHTMAILDIYWDYVIFTFLCSNAK